jgi:hypothetical protein
LNNRVVKEKQASYRPLKQNPRTGPAVCKRGEQALQDTPALKLRNEQCLSERPKVEPGPPPKVGGGTSLAVLQMNNSARQANCNRVRTVISAKLRKDARDVALDGRFANRELIRDLLIGISGGNQP